MALALALAVAILAGGCSTAGKGDKGDAAAARTTTTAARAGTSGPSSTLAVTTTSSTSSTTTTSLAPAIPTWQTRAPAPVARQEVGAAVVGGKVWVVGGLDASGALARVESYDPAADQWAAGPDLPLPLHHVAAAAYRGELVVVGGFTVGPDLYSTASDRVLVLRGGRWVDLPKLRRPRGAHASAVVADALVVVGGRDSARLITPTEVFDGTAWRDGAAIPSARDHLGAAAAGGGVYAVGGRRLDPNATSGAFERYDPARDSWERLADMPTARGGLGVESVGGVQIVAAGGEDASRVFAQVEAFDLRGNTWSTLPPMPTPRHGLAATAVGPVVYTLVGATRAGVAPSSGAEALTLPASAVSRPR